MKEPLLAIETKHTELLSRMEEVFTQATTQAAVAAYKTIEAAHNHRSELYPAEIKELKVRIDAAAVASMSKVLHAQDHFCVHSVGSEGAKEVLHDGEAAPSLSGKYGQERARRVDKVSDAVEGTVAAAQNKRGAVSVLAVSGANGLIPSQESQFYLEKLFGPRELNGKLSLAKSPRENIAKALSVLGIPPEELTVVILNRDRNRPYIEAARQSGVNLRLIEAGDLMPSILAVAGIKSHAKGAHLVMGIGGFEEGVIAAAAAKIRGGLAQCRRWSNDTQEFYDGILTRDMLVPGSRESTLVSVTAITGDEWMGLSPIMHVADERYRAQTLVITHKGMEVKWCYS